MEDRTLNWKQVLVTIVSTGVVTFLAGMLLYHYQMREPRLTYSVEDTLPFEGPSEKIAIYHVKIENNGKKIVEDVVCQLSFPMSKIMQTRLILAPSITYNESILDNSYRIKCLNLNPKESAILSVLVSSPDQLPTRPEISLRGKGVTGVEASRKTERKNDWKSIIPAALGAYTGLFIFILLWLGSKNLTGLKHSDDQRQVLSYVCGLHRLNSEVERYLNMPSKTSYWSESDRFAMLAIEEPVGEDSEKRKQVLKDLLKYAGIASSSEGIINYNIARIAKAQGKEEEADEYLKKAKKLIPKLVKTRLEIEPIWRNR